MDEQRAREDLAMIRRLLEDGRRDVVDRGKHFIIWGIVGGAGGVMTFAYAAGAAVPGPTWVWAAALVLGWVASLVVGWRDSRAACVHTFARRLLGGVWVAAAVSLTLIGLAGMLGDVVRYQSLPGVLSVVLAVPVLSTGLLTGERWLSVVAVGWWLGGAVMLFVPGPYTMLLMGIMAFLFMAVPGFVLNARARRSSSTGEGVLEAPS